VVSLFLCDETKYLEGSPHPCPSPLRGEGWDGRIGGISVWCDESIGVGDQVPRYPHLVASLFDPFGVDNHAPTDGTFVTIY
jgi:hypothetical protein